MDIERETISDNLRLIYSANFNLSCIEVVCTTK
jgi:hypothetical protein